MILRTCCVSLLLAFAAPTFASAAPNEAASQQAVEALQTFLSEKREARGDLQKQAFASVPLTKSDAAAAQKLLWDDHAAHLRATRSEELKSLKLTSDGVTMPIFYSRHGEKPAGGRSLYISMHGGGGAPKHVNDSQWINQQRLYSPKEGIYVAPRAPGDTWNLWHVAHIDSLFDRLIETMIVLEDVDPNRVYLLGYSAGGDGVYQLAPRMADRFAAAAMMAGHPNGNSPLGLRNLPFAIWAGGRDTAYNRHEEARKWGEQLAALKKLDPAGYTHDVHILADKGHWMDREDAAALPWMAKFNRNPRPEVVVWKQGGVVHPRFYWLAVPQGQAKGGSQIIAKRQGQSIDLALKDIEQVLVRLNDDMVDLDQPVTITMGGKRLTKVSATRTIATLARTLAERGDPQGIYSSEVEVELSK